MARKSMREEWCMKKIKRLLAALWVVSAFFSAAPGALAAAAGDLLVPVGQTVGIQIDCDGVMVSALAEFETESGAVCPAREAGLLPGDRIVAIGGESVHSGEEFLAKARALTGEPVELRAVRNGQTLSVTLQPRRGERNAWQLGLWLRSGVHGLGTVTFWDPATGRFGALGHGVSLSQGDGLMAMSRGVITAAAVADVVAGRRGVPGELCGLPEGEEVLGTEEENTLRGIFGTAGEALALREAVPVAKDADIHLGEASILSTVGPEGPREFAAEITRIARDGSETRQLTITVTDPELLAVTGGIVQGMSGSPILQDGQLVGAVTHVLVSDPTKGYGISMENMLKTTEALPSAA